MTILEYWFPPVGYDRHTSYPMEAMKLHFMGGKPIDDFLRTHYESLLEDIAAGRKEHWLADKDGLLAYVLVADQFSRNMHRDTAKAFSTDEIALKAAMTVLEDPSKYDEYKNFEKMFLLLCYEHSENIKHGLICEKEMKKIVDETSEEGVKKGMGSGLQFCRGHLKVLKRFGRYPSRNEALGRTSTKQELKYLESGNLWGVDENDKNNGGLTINQVHSGLKFAVA